MTASSRPYDLAVAYRIYPKVARSALGLPFSDDKYLLAAACLESFRRSLGTLRVRMWVLLDGCPAEYSDLFTAYFDSQDLTLLPLDEVGNYATFERQIDILMDQRDADLVYFAEDDYFYLPDQFRLMIELLRTNPDVDFVSPHDHLDCYTLALHRHPKWLKVCAGHHWRTAASTCLTFLSSQETLRQTADTFRTYSHRNFDSSVWLSLTKRSIFNPVSFLRYAQRQPHLAKVIAKAWLHGWRQILFGRRRKLWVPVPGIATHLDRSALSPAIDWPLLMREGSPSKVASSPV